MERIVNRIITVEKQARAVIADAERERDTLAETVEAELKSFRESEALRTEKEFKEFSEKEKLSAEQRLDAEDADLGHLNGRLDSISDSDISAWASDIVQRIVNGDE